MRTRLAQTAEAVSRRAAATGGDGGETDPALTSRSPLTLPSTGFKTEGAAADLVEWLPADGSPALDVSVTVRVAERSGGGNGRPGCRWIGAPGSCWLCSSGRWECGWRPASWRTLV